MGENDDGKRGGSRGRHRVAKVVGVVALVALGAGAALLWYGAHGPAVPADYQSSVKTSGEIEARYLADGPHGVSEASQQALQDFSRFEVFYPADLADSDMRWPVVVLCNGTGVPLSRYETLARHLASWGFVVIGTEEAYSWNAFGAEMCLRYLGRADAGELAGDDAPTDLAGHVDLGRVGVVGHSQGAVGALNAASDTDHAAAYRTVVALSPTNETLAHDLMWDFDASEVSVPTLLVAGAGGGDDAVVTGGQLGQIYDHLGSADKLMVRRTDTPHGEVLYSEEGYVCAWLRWQLQGDEGAARAFVGEDAEIAKNPLYQDVRTTITGE